MLIEAKPNFLLLELYLDNEPLADILSAYEINNDILLPLGELTRLLTIGVTVDYRTKVASGFILSEDRIFRLDIASQTVTLLTGTEPFTSEQVLWIDDDIYVSSKLLQRWFPLDLHIDLSRLSVTVAPREKLPIQLRLDREQLAKGLRRRDGSYIDPGYPRASKEYDLFSMPFIDQTLGVDFTNSQQEWNSAYSALMTADLLGTEASMYLTSTKAKPNPDVRMILARYDPDANLLGPLRARSVVAGNISVPTLANVLRGGGGGNGIMLSNKPLNQSSSYGLQTLRGDLAVGWDVTLYFNDALIGFQQSRPDGFYVFEDQPLVYGTNEFRLVFNGPLGQTRVEREMYVLDQTLTKPGESFYTIATQKVDTGGERQTLQFDLGLTKNIALTGGFVRLPDIINDRQQSYTDFGIRGSTLGMLLSADYVRNNSGGSLYTLGLKTQVQRFSIDYTHTKLQDNFVSDFYTATTDAIDTRDRGRITGAISVTEKFRLPISLNINRDVTLSGLQRLDVSARTSAYFLKTNFTNSVNWHSMSSSANTADGVLQVSKRLAGFGLSGQLVYSLKPTTKITSYALSVNKNFGDTMRVNGGILHSRDSGVSTLTAGINRNFGSFSLGISSQYTSTDELAIGLQLFMSMGRDPRTSKWMFDWRPMASAGAISTRTYIDTNMNGQFDLGETLVSGVGYTLNGGMRHPVKSNELGEAYLHHISPKKYTDIAIDSGTLEDPQWQPATPGYRVLSRPGKVQVLDFPVVMTGEIDGTIYLKTEEGGTRGIGAAQVELIDAKGNIAVTTTSAYDGYYILAAIRPGIYTVRISPEQAERLGLMSSQSKKIKITADGEFINSLNFTVERKLY